MDPNRTPELDEAAQWMVIQALVFIGLSVYIGDYLVQYYQRRRADRALARSHGCRLPPELPKRWPLGIDRIKQIWDWNAKGQLLAFFDSIADHYEPGNNLYQHFLFGPRGFHIMHPKNIETALSTNFKDYGFGSRPAVFAPLLGNGIFTQEGNAWKHSRELLRRQFARAQYQNLHHFREHLGNLLQRIGDGGVIDLQPLFFDLTMDVATEVLFGHSVYSLRANIDQNAKNREFAESFNIAQEGLAKRFRLAPFHFVYNPREFRQACKKVHQFVEEYIKERKMRNSSKVDESTSSFIDQVAQESATVAELRDQLLNVLLAGRDTTACCLSWTFRLLVRHASTLERLRKEIESVMGKEAEPSREQIRKMPFLSCVIKESLRLYPPVPLNNREAINSTVLPTGGGPDGKSPMLVRKGELVIFSQYAVSRRKNVYGADAKEFRPERWETGELANIGWGYFPFNGGPRQCLGEDFALMEVSFTIVCLLQNYRKIVLPEGEPNEAVGTERQRLTLVLSSADGCRVDIAV